MSTRFPLAPAKRGESETRGELSKADWLRQNVRGQLLAVTVGAAPHREEMTGRRGSLKGGVTDGTRTRNSQNHNLGLYH